MIVIAHVSDLHIDNSPRSIDRTRAVMAYLEDLPYDLDALLVTGDIADHGLPSEYAETRGLLASRHPVVVCPGNHDERAAFREHLLGDAAATPGPVNQVHHTPGLTLAVCDSSVPGKDHGHLDDETLTWLDGVLTETTNPVLVAFHHPPATLNTPYVDGIRLFDEQPLAALAARHPHLTAFLTGHAHTPAATTFAGRPLLVAPGVVSTLRLPWERRAHPDDHVHLDLPPALAFHVLDAEGRLTTHFRSVIL
ncbi:MULTISPECIES: metallophosphoesterase [unclassified Streptomyces]|uniref:metallophosphoesterase n=1 Tax=unclassified Streptomyces TaxID=2593676 RepID=UPI002E7FEB5D|nr:metallophosphoesterase [Streptomyces sp. NBC_00589]WTI39438.1 metallophosphoesterase [Streptomyces sp. NBC_00775]WUB26884.1 metallophosphoesterase [Streptomyces sp. NBC_00589]